MLTHEGGGVGNRSLGVDRSIRLDMERQAIEVGALTDARLFDREVRAADRIVHRVDTYEVYRSAPRNRVRARQHKAAPLIDVQLHIDGAFFL